MTLQRRVRRSIGKNISFYLTGTVLTAITIMLLVGAFAVSIHYMTDLSDFCAEPDRGR